MAYDPTKFICCVHCGASILAVRFRAVPVSKEHALTIACEPCFTRLPAEALASPDLPDYLSGAMSDMPAYRQSVMFMKGCSPVSPEYFWPYLRGGVREASETA